MAGIFDIVDSAVNTYTTVNPILQNILIAALILLLGLVAGKLLGKFVKRILGEFEADKNLKSMLGWGFSIERSASNFITYFTYFVAIIMALDTIGVTSAVLNMIAGIIVLLLFISVILAVKDFLPNLMAGIMIRSRKDLKKGVKIEIKGIKGKIKEIGMIETKLETKSDVILVPNSLFTKHESVIKK